MKQKHDVYNFQIYTYTHILTHTRAPCNQVINLLCQNHHNHIFRYANLQLFHGLERKLELIYKCSEKKRILINRPQEANTCQMINKC